MDGTILENEYTDIVNYLYNSKDATTLRLLLRSEANRIKEEKYLTGEDEDEDAIGDDEVKHVASVGKKSATGGTTRRNSASMGSGTRRLSYENKKLGFERKVPLSMRKESIARSKQEHFQAVKDNFDLPFDVFMKCVLEFQMSAHENYLAGFKHIFRHYDDDGDGVLTSEQFRKCYMRLRTHGADAPIARVSFADDDGDAEKGSGMVANRWSKQEENAFLGLLSIIDPAETDRKSPPIALQQQ
ncbi:unnamed protein product [Symbiodinium microadriaticum]|nr:unnamed protein product [Symbiodinium microadriaticum]